MAWDGTSRGFPTRIRKRILRRDPICRCTRTDCGFHEPGRCTAPSTEADHIVPWVRSYDDRITNGQGLCAPCHATKTRQEIAEGRTAKARRRPTSRPHPGRKPMSIADPTPPPVQPELPDVDDPNEDDEVVPLDPDEDGTEDDSDDEADPPTEAGTAAS